MICVPSSYTDSGLGHVTCFGHGDTSKHDANSLVKLVRWGLSSWNTAINSIKGHFEDETPHGEWSVTPANPLTKCSCISKSRQDEQKKGPEPT